MGKCPTLAGRRTTFYMYIFVQINTYPPAGFARFLLHYKVATIIFVSHCNSFFFPLKNLPPLGSARKLYILTCVFAFIFCFHNVLGNAMGKITRLRR